MTAIHIDEIKSIARQANADPDVRERLVADVLGSERDTAVQSAWALTHLSKGGYVSLATHREALTVKAISTADTSLRRLSLALLERLDWPTEDEPPEYYMRLLDFCLTHMMLATEPYGVRALCMKLAYRIAQPYPDLLGELHRSLLLLEPSELSPGVRCTYNKILKWSKS